MVKASSVLMIATKAISSGFVPYRRKVSINNKKTLCQHKSVEQSDAIQDYRQTIASTGLLRRYAPRNDGFRAESGFDDKGKSVTFYVLMFWSKAGFPVLMLWDKAIFSA